MSAHELKIVIIVPVIFGIIFLILIIIISNIFPGVFCRLFKRKGESASGQTWRRQSSGCTGGSEGTCGWASAVKAEPFHFRILRSELRALPPAPGTQRLRREPPLSWLETPCPGAVGPGAGRGGCYVSLGAPGGRQGSRVRAVHRGHSPPELPLCSPVIRPVLTLCAHVLFPLAGLWPRWCFTGICRGKDTMS